MQIIDTNLITKPIARRRITSRIVVHHTAGADHSAAEIHRMHLNRGFSGIGYHYIVRTNGSIERGRPEELRGAHAGKANADSIGIGLTGNFEKRVPATAQMDALAWLIGDIRQRRGRDITVIRHSDVMATKCPGRLFPWAELQVRLAQPTSRPAAQPAAQPNEALYTVRAGDTLWGIARRYGVTIPQLNAWNGLKTNILTIGQTLIVEE